MKKTIFKDSLRDDGGSLRLRCERHVLCLHIRGKTWIFLCGNVCRAQSVRSLDLQFRFSPRRDLNAKFREFRNDGGQMLRLCVIQDEVAGCDCGSGNEGPGLDAVRNNAVFRSVEAWNAADAEA